MQDVFYYGEKMTMFLNLLDTCQSHFVTQNVELAQSRETISPWFAKLPY